MGRPTLYSQELAARICGELVEGRSLRAICREEDMPCTASVFLWLIQHPEFSDQYARAREAQADSLADELLDIADDSTNDWIDRETRSGRIIRVVDEEAIGRSRLRVDTRKWIASKLKPKKYGEKLELGGAVGSYAAQPIPVEEREEPPVKRG